MPGWENDILIEQTKVIREAPGKHPDILVVHHSIPPVAIETSAQRGDADRDAIERLGKYYTGNNRPIQTTIAVELQPEDMGLSSITPEHTIRYALHQHMHRFPPNGFIVGNIHDLARLVVTTAVPKEEMEDVADKVSTNVKAAAQILEPSIKEEDLVEISHTLYQRSAITGLQTTMILWLNALLVQHRLYGGEYDIPQMSSTPSECVKAWRIIHNINWKAIFEPAINILESLSSRAISEVSEALHLLIDSVEVVETARLGMDINISAELFPKMAEDRKQSAAFYTQPATAELLASLTILYNMTEWDVDVFKRFKIADITCGTGTLLRFGYRQVKQHYVQNGCNTQRLHSTAMEEGLFGTDVSPIATHLTSTGLALDSKQPYGDTNIGWVGVGNVNRTGAIEYITTNSIPDLMLDMFGRSTGEGATAEYNSVSIKDESIDVILMNPPYTRTRGGLRAFDMGGLSDKERKACQERWGKLIKDEPCVKTAGMAATFLCVAHKKVKPGGRFGFVLPKTMAFAPTWRKTRNMIEEDFEDILAISVSAGKARNRTGLSADTGLEEMLLVAKRKRVQDKKRSNVRCVTLYEPPSRLGEAAEIARAIMGGPNDGPDVLGMGVSIMFNTDDGAPWSSVGVIHEGANRIANSIVSGEIETVDGTPIANIPMTTVEELFDVGPTHHLIGHPVGKTAIGAFTLYPIKSKNDAIGKYRSLWKADAKAQTKLIVSPTHKGVVCSEVEAEMMWERHSTLFYSRGMRWDTQCVVAATTAHLVMGGRSWTGLLHRNECVMKAFALWANSIFGMMVHWTQGSRTDPGRASLQVNGIKKLPCLNIAQLDKNVLKRAAADFDKLSKLELLPAWEADRDNTRTKINNAVCKMLGVRNYDTTVLASIWCEEPSVRHNKPSSIARE